MKAGLFLSLLLWALIALCAVAYAENIGGVIINKDTRVVIPGIDVEIIEYRCDGCHTKNWPALATVKTDGFGSWNLCVEPGAVFKIIPKSVGIEPNMQYIDLRKPCK